MRTIVEIPAEQIAALAEVCRREGISRAEAIRRAVREYTSRRGRSRGSHDAFGIWKGRGVDALSYEDEIRDEWMPRHEP